MAPIVFFKPSETTLEDWINSGIKDYSALNMDEIPNYINIMTIEKWEDKYSVPNMKKKNHFLISRTFPCFYVRAHD